MNSPDRAAVADAAWLKRMLLPAAALMLASAWWCTGFVQGDEHFQVLECAGARLGLSRITDLPWEYAARARSWLLPAIALEVRRAMLAFGWNDPFFCAFLLRALSGTLYLAAASRFALATSGWFKSRAQWRTTVILALGLWFVPVVAARFSAESWSGSLFFLGFATLVRTRDGERCSELEIFLAGAALGLAFVARFPVFLLDAGAAIWLLRAGGLPRRAWGVLGAGAFIACAASAGLDAWGYGRATFPLWNYYVAQVPGGVLSSYGVAPWWWYVPALAHGAGWPVGLALLAGFAALCVRRRSPALAWTLVPFLAFHMLVGHKELRFLFPMLVAAPYVIVLGLDGWWPAGFFARHRVATRCLIAAVALLNGAAFVARLSVPMEPRVAVQEAVFRSGARTVVVVGDHDPYIWWNLRANWYRPAGLHVVRAVDLAEARRFTASTPDALLVTRFPERPDSADGSCRVVHQSVPISFDERWRALLGDFIPVRDNEPGWWFVGLCDPAAGAAHAG